jgi:aerobic carbon-monoxide dehydrogenase medium subunit
VIPPVFRYQRAGSVEEALAHLTSYGDEAKVLAGGHSLLPMMKLRLASPAVLVDIGRISDLRDIRLDGDQVVIGALCTHAQLASSALVGEHLPLLARAASLIGDPQVRHRGTIGGSLAHADPKADHPLAALACGATMVVQGPRARREVGVDDFFLGYFTTAVGPDELLVEIRFPSAAGLGWGYEKLVGRANDWAVVGVATVGGRIALAAMGDRPLRARAAEEALAAGLGIEAAAEQAAEGTEPNVDTAGDAEYRAHLARVLTRRALRSAAGA